MTLVEVLADPKRKQAVVADGVALLEREVASKGGLSGAAVKTGFKALKKIRPGIVEQAMDALVPRFAPKVDPHFAKARASGNVQGYFVRHADVIANDLLAVTDERARASSHGSLRRLYSGLRPQALKHVVAAMPGLAALCERHVPA